MNKTVIKNFAIWARNKLIEDITAKTILLGITEKGISNPLPSSTKDIHFFDIGTKEPYSISGNELKQREQLVKELEKRAQQGDYNTAYTNLLEEVAYTWFNRLIAIRLMEVNDYLPSRVRVLSSETKNKTEPDIVTSPFAADLNFTEEEKQTILQMKHTNKLDELFRMLFIKQCNALHDNLPELFEKINDYTELLLQVSFTDKDGVLYNLVNDIDEDDFNVEKEGQVEIIGWLYQFYNTEPKDETFKLLKKNVKITKERIPSATQLFTPDWIVRYMVENSLGRLWVEGHPNEELKNNWKYFLEEAEQEEDVQKQLEEIREEYSKIRPEDIKIIDPAMGSGHILVYAFDVLMQIYESQGYSQRDAAKSIIENNLYGLDIDKRAYQLAYFAVMMKARQYNRRILDIGIKPRLYAFEESNGINRNHLKFFGAGLSDMEKNTAKLQMEGLLDTFKDAKEYGSILNLENYDWELLRRFILSIEDKGQLSVETMGINYTRDLLEKFATLGEVMTKKYEAVVTNPPYMGSAGMNSRISDYAKRHYRKSKTDMYSIMIEKSIFMTNRIGYTSMITMQSWMNASTFKEFRHWLFRYYRFSVVNNLGSRAFSEIQGEKVKNVAFVINKKAVSGWIPTFVDLTEVNGEKEKEQLFLQHKNLYSHVPQDNFFNHESCLIVYKTKHFNEIYNPNKTLSDVSEVKRCIATGDDDTYIRLWQEVGCNSISDYEIREDKKWYFLSNGGIYKKWFGNINSVINWENNGKDIKIFNENTRKATLRNLKYLFREGATYTYTSMGSGIFNARVLNKGMISIGVGPVIVDIDDTMYVIGYLNSCVFRWFLENMYGKVSTFETGNIGRIPYKEFKNANTIQEKVTLCIEEAKKEWSMFETSWDFDKHPMLTSNTIESAYNKFKQECEERFTKLKANEGELNRIFIKIYGLQDELAPDVDDKDVTVARIYDNKKDIPVSMKGNGYVLTKQDVIKSFLSYAVGCMFGRYSLYVEGLAFAGGEWDESKYNSFIPDEDNIIPITDEEYFKDDIVGLFVAFVNNVYGEDTLEKNLSFIADALGNNGDNPREVIRNYFLNDFFKDHVKIYKKRPIYWLFDSGKKNGFKALVYLHRYDVNTIGKLRVEYLHNMQRIYEGEIKRMEQTIEESTDSREVNLATKRQEKLIKQLQETREYDERITHLALERISLDLDDGVKVNYEKVQTDREGKKHEVLAKI